VRFVTILVGAALVFGLAVVAWTTIFRPPPASARLAGVSVAVQAFTIDDLDGDRHRLTLTTTVSSVRDLEECVAFALDEPFAGRRLRAVGGDCTRPRTGRITVELVTEALTQDDLRFPSHTLVWGVAGGRCGPILTLFGVCVVDQAGTTAVQLPSTPVLPSFGGFGSFGPIGPFFSFPPP
jgi:hypothetical protein